MLAENKATITHGFMTYSKARRRLGKLASRQNDRTVQYNVNWRKEDNWTVHSTSEKKIAGMLVLCCLLVSKLSRVYD